MTTSIKAEDHVAINRAWPGVTHVHEVVSNSRRVGIFRWKKNRREWVFLPDFGVHVDPGFTVRAWAHLANHLGVIFLEDGE